MAIQKIELAWITVSDLEKSVKFFVESLGLDVHQPCNMEVGWAEVRAKGGGCLLGIAQDGEGCPSCCCDHPRKCDKNAPCMTRNAVLTFTVDNLDATVKELEKAGVHFVSEVLEIPDGPRMISFVDLDDNVFQLTEPCKMEQR